MTDHDDLGPADARAEQAFTHAFAQAEHLDATTRIDPGVIRRRALTRSRLKVGGSALAVLLVAGGIVGGVQLAKDESPGIPPTGLPNYDGPAPDGLRYDYFRDVRVTVPDSWGYDSEPGSDWCASTGRSLPDKPYVDLGGSGFVLGIGCPLTNGQTEGEFSNEPPTGQWVVHLSLQRAGNASAETREVNGWWVLSEQVGSVLVKAVSQDRDEAGALLATATTVEDGASGCLNHSPIQNSAFPRPDPAFDVTSLSAVDSIIVCQYGDLLDDNAPGLRGRAIITGEDADDVLHAIQAAPPGGGPDKPQNCMDDDPGDDAIELHLISGDTMHSMFVFYSTCHGNGFDDGTTLRELTADACQPLIQPPVRIWGGSSASFERCVEG